MAPDAIVFHPAAMTNLPLRLSQLSVP
jgi:hypothetical protein